MNYEKYDLSDERILVIGGCGFIGHNLVPVLRKAKCEVMVIDNLIHNNLIDFWSKRPDLPSFKREFYLELLKDRLNLIFESGCRFEKIDSRNFSDLQNIFKKFDPTKVIHLAAIVHAKKANTYPDVAFENSIVTLKNSLECIRTNPGNVNLLIYLSSSMVYGDFPKDGVYEDSPLKPKGMYGTLKLCAEQIMIAYNRVYGIPYTIIRPSALYGPRCVSRRVTSLFVENALENNPIRIEGDGEDKLDFTYIDDLVQGVFRVVVNKEARNQIFNMTFGESRSINELVEILKKNFSGVRIIREERDPLRPLRGTLKIDKAKELLGYNPEYPVESGYPKYIDWYKRVLSKGMKRK
ncbi:MAG: NAD-dependent epimerase/dehydratase family protein [Candidatus Aminicenantaceae bacterium]